MTLIVKFSYDCIVARSRAAAASAVIMGIILQTAIFHLYDRLAGPLAPRAPALARAAIAAVAALAAGT